MNRVLTSIAITARRPRVRLWAGFGGLLTLGAFIVPFPAHAQRQMPAMGTGIGGQMAFEQRCTACHGFGSTVERAPKPDVLMKMAPETIYAALDSGVMMVQAKDLSAAQKKSIAEFLGGRPMGNADAGAGARMPNQCTANPPISASIAGPSWNGWGAGPRNDRFQSASASGLTAAQVPRLALTWAFGFPNGAEAFGQPTIAAGRVFVGSDNGYIYALDAATGCVHWSYRAQSPIRTAISIGPVTGRAGSRYGVYFGDLRSNVYGLDAATGKPLWTAKAETHPLSKITGAPTLFENRLYVPVSSSEEVTASAATYPCCTFRGSIVAYDASNGTQVWKTYLIPEAPTPRGKNAAGTDLWSGAGSAVWSAPTVDAKRGLLYVGTGDAFTEPAHPTSDAIVALDLKTGAVTWIHQALAEDAWIAGCSPSNANCPKKPGPDFDVAASPMLQTLPTGRDVIIGAHKGGVVFAIDPDRQGAQIWSINLAERAPGPSGLITFGGAADAQSAYFGLATGGIVSLSLAKGERNWFAPLAPQAAEAGRQPRRGQTAALSGIPGVVFSGGWDGVLRALATSDGRVLWSYDTAKPFETVNGVKATGGSMGAPGATVAGGMLFVGSGYTGIGNGMPGNALLAFSAK